MSLIRRTLNLTFDNHRAILLLGPRKTGKSTFLKSVFSDAEVIDLLQADTRLTYTLHPEKLRQKVLSSKPSLLILDEIQKAPELLDEVHWCIENTPTKIVLCGSSARRLKRISSGILGGRAVRYEFFPLTSYEIGDVDLYRAFNHGLIPLHYLAKDPVRLLRTYLIDYLEEEIRQEAVVRNLPAFSRFLEAAALMNGELLNFENAARESGVSAPTIKGYYKILEDTLFGFYLHPWRKSQSRRLIETRKFYLFDCGVVRALREYRVVEPKSMEAGRFFETFILNEVRAYQSYRGRFDSLFFWRTSNLLEVDLIIGRVPKLAVEFKCSEKIRPEDFKGLRAFLEEYPKTSYKCLVHCGVDTLRTEDGIDILPWQGFLKNLWKGTYF